MSTSSNTLHKWHGSDLDYQQTWDYQLDYIAGILDGSKSDCFHYLEHKPVYTIGRTRDKSSWGNPEMLPHPFVEINRGGQATYHGPGQLVGYPLIDLRPLGKDLHKYIRAIEEALILTCADFGLTAGRRDGLTGVWVENRKLASIGVGVKKWIAMHGFAINVTKESLKGFLSITPCGIGGVSMTTVSSELGQDISVKEFAKASEKHFEACIYGLRSEAT